MKDRQEWSISQQTTLIKSDKINQPHIFSDFSNITVAI
jgi:hypothetical protein